MWLHIQNSLSYDKKILGISLAIAIVISLFIIFGSNDYEGEVDSTFVSWVYFNAYIVSLVLSVIFYSQEGRERLYTQLPLTRLQITLSDLIVWFIWTALFYSANCFILIITSVPIKPEFFIGLFLAYLFSMSIMALIEIASKLSNYRNRKWQAVYIFSLVVSLIAFVDRENPPQDADEWIQLTFFGTPYSLLTISPLLAAISIGVMCLIQMRRDFYLK